MPCHWPLPKYSLGQPTTKGTIVGIQYYLVDNFLADFGNGYWRYAVLDKNDYSEIMHLSEQEIQPLTLQEVKAQVHAEIETHRQRISILQATLQSLTINAAD